MAYCFKPAMNKIRKLLHDLSSPLTVALGHVELLLARKAENSPSDENLFREGLIKVSSSLSKLSDSLTKIKVEEDKLSNTITLFEREFFVSFRQADPAAVVYFAELFDLAHQCLESFIVDLGLSWKTWFLNEDWAAPIRSCTANFTHPIFPGSPVKVSIKGISRGETHLTFRFHFEQTKPCAEIDLTVTFVDRKTGAKEKVPAVVDSLLFSQSKPEHPH